MRRFRNIFCFGVLLCLVSWVHTGKMRKIDLFQNQVSIEVPEKWKYKENFQKYVNYQVKYNAIISHNKTKSIITVVVYDSSHMYNATLDNKLLESFKEAQIKAKGQSVTFTSLDISKINGHDVGKLAYTFEKNNGRKCYGVQLFFRTSINYFYEIEILSLNTPSKEFAHIADRIIRSLKFN